MLGKRLRDRHRLRVVGVALVAFVAALLPWFLPVREPGPRYRSTGAVVPTAASAVERIEGRSLLSEPFLASLVRMAQLAQTDPTARISRRAGTLVLEVSAEGPTRPSAEASAERALTAAVHAVEVIAGPTGDIDVRSFPASPAVRVPRDDAAPWLQLCFAAASAVLAAGVAHRIRSGGITRSAVGSGVEVPSIPEFAAIVAGLATRQGAQRVVLDVDDVPHIASGLSTALVRRGLTITSEGGADTVLVLALHRGRRPEERARLARQLNAHALLVAG